MLQKTAGCDWQKAKDQQARILFEKGLDTKIETDILQKQG